MNPMHIYIAQTKIIKQWSLGLLSDEEAKQLFKKLMRIK